MFQHTYYNKKHNIKTQVIIQHKPWSLVVLWAGGFPAVAATLGAYENWTGAALPNHHSQTSWSLYHAQPDHLVTDKLIVVSQPNRLSGLFDDLPHSTPACTHGNDMIQSTLHKPVAPAPNLFYFSIIPVQVSECHFLWGSQLVSACFVE